MCATAKNSKKITKKPPFEGFKVGDVNKSNKSKKLIANAISNRFHTTQAKSSKIITFTEVSLFDTSVCRPS